VPHDLLPRLYAALDEHRFDDLADLFTPDARATTPGGVVEGREAVVAQATRNHARVNRLQHLVTGVLVVEHDDTVALRADLVAVFADADGTPTFELGSVWRGSARRRDGRWRITDFTLTPIWQRGARP
jgi:uncharacterized protein (TIGR02246 family)